MQQPIPQLDLTRIFPLCAVTSSDFKIYIRLARHCARSYSKQYLQCLAMLDLETRTWC